MALRSRTSTVRDPCRTSRSIQGRKKSSVSDKGIENEVIGGKSVLGEKERLLKLCLLGKIFGKQVRFLKIVRELRREWTDRIAGTVKLTKMPKKWIAVEFSVAEDVEFVLANRPWVIKESIFHMRRWIPSFDPRDASVEDLVVWIHLPGLPIHCWSEKGILPEVEKVGKFIKLDTSTEQYEDYNYARVYIMVGDEENQDVAIPSVPTYTPVRVFVSYEYLFEVCFECGSHKQCLSVNQSL